MPSVSGRFSRHKLTGGMFAPVTSPRRESMTREEFLALPLKEALGAIWDLSPQRFEAMKAPVVTRPASPVRAGGRGLAPKYDQVVYRKDGVQYASEMDLSSLVYWRDRSAAGIDDPKYGEKNEKTAKSLTYWIEYREKNPMAQWSGERNRQHVTAEVPSDDAAIYPREPRAPSPYGAQRSGPPRGTQHRETRAADPEPEPPEQQLFSAEDDIPF
jgi:hypothetical protein